jgi:hypothetical protein
MDVFNPVKTARFLWHRLTLKIFTLYITVLGIRKGRSFKRGSYPRRKHGNGEGGDHFLKAKMPGCQWLGRRKLKIKADKGSSFML